MRNTDLRLLAQHSRPVLNPRFHAVTETTNPRSMLLGQGDSPNHTELPPWIISNPDADTRQHETD